MIDHRDLLKKYAALVGYEEGTDFISHAKTSEDLTFTDEELSELSDISEEALNDY